MPWKTKTYRPPHAQAERAGTARQYDQSSERVESHRFYTSKRWRRFRKLLLARNPICQMCGEVVATQVHHDAARRDRPDLAFCDANMIAACGPCHSRVEAKRRAGGAAQISDRCDRLTARQKKHEFSRKNSYDR
jgi:5-methylcytosine-specific restriction enzyme A